MGLVLQRSHIPWVITSFIRETVCFRLYSLDRQVAYRACIAILQHFRTNRERLPVPENVIMRGYTGDDPVCVDLFRGIGSTPERQAPPHSVGGHNTHRQRKPNLQPAVEFHSVRDPIVTQCLRPQSVNSQASFRKDSFWPRTTRSGG